MARSENGAHPVRRPTGLRRVWWFTIFSVNGRGPSELHSGLSPCLNPTLRGRIPLAMLTATVTDCLSDAPRSAPSVDIDQALARTAAGGEVAAFEALYRRHLGRVHGVFGRMVGHRVRAPRIRRRASCQIACTTPMRCASLTQRAALA